MYEMTATGELPTIRIGQAVRVSTNALQKWVKDVNSKEVWSREQRRQETRARAKYVATHIATPKISGGKWQKSGQ